MAVELQLRIQEDTATAKRNLYCEVHTQDALLCMPACLLLIWAGGGPPAAEPINLLCIASCCPPWFLARGLFWLALMGLPACCLQTCHKQYKTAAELDTHLSSYDHHHKKVGAPLACTMRLPLCAARLATEAGTAKRDHRNCRCKGAHGEAPVCAAQRLIEMKAMNAERTKGERSRKERRRQEKEAAKLQEQCGPLSP